MNHVELTRLSASSARNEIRSSKQWVEDTVSRPSVAFCYPRGKHNRAIASMVRAAGFTGARTVMLNTTGVPHNPFRWGVSTQAYSHSPAIQIRHALRETNIAGLHGYGRVFRFERRWDRHFRRALDSVEERGGVAHLFLHGWEIEDQNDWEALDSVLRDAASRTRMKCVTNGELFSHWCELTNSQEVSSS
jgi:peptidoglycan/xylan/chitin deacetylase (PgdA/CDA1 family)